MHILCMKANTKAEAKTNENGNESGPDCYERLSQAESQRSRREGRRRQNVDESNHAKVRVVWQSTVVEEDTAMTDREIEGFSCERLSNRGNESDVESIPALADSETDSDSDFMPEAADGSESESMNGLSDDNGGHGHVLSKVRVWER